MAVASPPHSLPGGAEFSTTGGWRALGRSLTTRAHGASAEGVWARSGGNIKMATIPPPAQAARDVHTAARRQRAGRMGVAERVWYHEDGHHPAARLGSAGRQAAWRQRGGRMGAAERVGYHVGGQHHTARSSSWIRTRRTAPARREGVVSSSSVLPGGAEFSTTG